MKKHAFMKKSLYEFGLVALAICCVTLLYSKALEAREDKAKKPMMQDYLDQTKPKYVPGEVLVGLKEGVDLQAVLKETKLKSASIKRINPIAPAVAKFKKEYKLDKDSDSWFWFFGKNYRAMSDVPDEAVFQKAYQEMSATEKALYDSYKITLPKDASVEEAIVRLTKNAKVKYAQPNFIMQLSAEPLPQLPYLPNDYYLKDGLNWRQGSWGQAYPDLWGLRNTKTLEAWNLFDTNKNGIIDAGEKVPGEGAVVAVIDSGVDYNHPDLRQNIWINAGEDINGNGKFDGETFKDSGVDGLYDYEEPDYNNYNLDPSKDNYDPEKNPTGTEGNHICDPGEPFFDYGLDRIPQTNDLGEGNGLFDAGDQNGLDDDANGYVDDIIGYDVSDNDNDPNDYMGHGTHCAGTIAAVANNNIGIAGVAPGAKIMPVKFFPNSESAAVAIKYAADNGAHILSNSWGPSWPIRSQPVIEDVIKHAYDERNCLVVFAAGNEDGDVMGYSPNNYVKTLAVAALDQNDLRCDFSNFGKLIAVSAPGGGSAADDDPNGPNTYKLGRRNILSLRAQGLDMYAESDKQKGWPEGISLVPQFDSASQYYRSQGTSMACPHVAGLAAVIKSMYPELSNSGIYSRIVLGADNIDSLNAGTADSMSFAGLLGKGRFNTYNSLTISDRPYLKIAYVENDAFGPGKTANIIVHLQNYWQAVAGITGTLSTSKEFVTISKANAVFGDLANNQIKTNSQNPFVVSISPQCPYGSNIDFTLTVSNQSGYAQTLYFTIKIAFFQDISKQPEFGLPLDDLLSTGISMEDYNRDDYSDMYYTGFAIANLFRNSQQGKFVNASSETGVRQGDYTYWVPVFLDIDNDGDKDIFVGRRGGDPDEMSLLYRNNGNGTFTDISQASGISDSATENAIAFDYNQDGFVDIVCGFAGYWDTGRVYILRNNGDSTFTKVSKEAGIPDGIKMLTGGLLAFDYDNDNAQDLLIVSYSATETITLLHNNGLGVFTDVTQAAGIDTSRNQAYVAAAGDYNNDGLMDFFISGLAYDDKNPQPISALYRNNGNGTFTDVTIEALKPGEWEGWKGTDFFDYDNDGDLDLYITGTVNSISRNNGDGTFTNVGDVAFPDGVSPGFSGAAIGDCNNDGALDIYAPSGMFASSQGAFLKNLVGQQNNWIKIKLQDATSNSFGYGARVSVKTGSLVQMRQMHTGAVEAMPLHFGIGKATVIDEIKVSWPNGRVETFTNVEPNRLITITAAAYMHLQSISPNLANCGDTVTLKGKVFGAAQGSGYVEFATGLRAQIQRWTDIEITCVVPQAAISGPVFLVNANGKKSNGLYFRKDSLPVIQPIGDKTVDEGQPLSFSIAAADPDGDQLSYSMRGLPPNATFVDQVFSWTPDYYQANIYEVTFSVWDGQAEVAQTIHITVNNVNQPPVFNYLNNVSVDISKTNTLAFTVSATDPDYDTILNFTHPLPTELPEGATFTTTEKGYGKAKGLFSWSPTPAQIGVHTVTFAVSDGKEEKSQSITITVKKAPKAPTQLEATKVTHDQIEVHWQDNSDDEDGFKLIFTDVDGYSLGGRLNTKDTTFKFYQLDPDTTYFVKVAAYNNIGDSEYSNLLEVRTLNIPPSHLVAVPTLSNVMHLEWQAALGLESSFVIERSLDGSSFATLSTEPVAGNNRYYSYDDISAVVGTHYYYRVCSRNATGRYSAYSNIAKATIPLGPPPVPTNLKAEGGNQEISLTWEDSSGTATNFELQRRSVDGVNFFAINTALVTNSFVDGSLDPGTRYYYRVRAHNIRGDSAYSELVSATTLPSPIAPTNLEVTQVDSYSIGLRWKDNSDNEEKFRIYYGAVAGTQGWLLGAEVAADTGSGSAEHLYPDTVYRLRVNAYNSAGNSESSNIVEARTLRAPPRYLGACVLSDNIVLLMMDDVVADTSAILVERSPDNIAFTQIATVSSQPLIYRDTNCTGGTTYYYRIRSQNSEGRYSGYSSVAEVTVNTPPAVVSLSPNTGVYKTETPCIFSAVYSDPDGVGDLIGMHLRVGIDTDPQGVLYTYYDPVVNKLYLYNGSVFVGGYAPGSNNVIDTSYGKLYCNLTTVSVSGNNATIKWVVSFKTTFFGAKKVYLSAYDLEETTSWQQKGSIVITNPPTAESITPDSGTFETDKIYKFSTVYSDLDGYTNLRTLNFRISIGSKHLWARYDRPTNKLYFYDGSTYKFIGGYALGSNNVIDAPFGKLYCVHTSWIGTGNNLTIKWAVSFKAAIVGTASMYLYSYDNSNVGQVNWEKKGTITIVPTRPPPARRR